MRRLAAVLLAGADDARFSGEELRGAADLHGRRLNPLLKLLLDRGWLADGWDGPTPADAQRYYVLTDTGRRELSRP